MCVLFVLYLMPSKIHSELFFTVFCVLETQLCGLTYWASCQLAFSWAWPIVVTDQRWEEREVRVFPLSPHPCSEEGYVSPSLQLPLEAPFEVPPLSELPYNTIPSPCP